VYADPRADHRAATSDDEVNQREGDEVDRDLLKLLEEEDKRDGSAPSRPGKDEGSRDQVVALGVDAAQPLGLGGIIADVVADQRRHILIADHVADLDRAELHLDMVLGDAAGLQIMDR
jgi:hypothetical protein